MKRFVVERTFPQELEMTPELNSTAVEQFKQDGIEWLYSFLSADKKKTYCLYEAPDPSAIRASSEKLNLPIDSIVELSGELRPNTFA
ncbi:MAG: DUF4242 domain-containing protein [Planctomycetales bacterium]|nr:DUF4242 domain-containing protein [Planctomycetales bacterium]